MSKLSKSTKEKLQENEAVSLNTLKGKFGSTSKRKRVGRGAGSGTGKTSGRGMKGQQSRSGYSRKVGFEGGQMPLQRRLPKRGFNNRFRKNYSEINVGTLDNLEDGITLDFQNFLKMGLASKKSKDGIKLLGFGDIKKKFHLKIQKCSKSARQKIEDAGGTIEIVGVNVTLEDSN